MGHNHSHRAASGDDRQVRVDAVPRTVVLSVLGLIAALTVVGLVAWWPAGDVAEERAEQAGGAASFTAPGVRFVTGEVVEVVDTCEGEQRPGEVCGTLRVDVGDTVAEVPAPPEVLAAGVEAGDRVELQRTPPPEGASEAMAGYSYFATDRDSTLTWLFALFGVVVLAVARWRGMFAMVGLAVGGAVVWWFMLPALLDGAPGVGVALAGSAAIMYVVLYTTHGLSMRTSTALLGTLVGILMVTGLSVLAISDARLTGVSDESAGILTAFGGELDFTSLLGCALVIAGLGVLNDVTITQASAVWELRAASPAASRLRVFSSAMRIGRDHIASAIYTIVFAYVGTALLTLMLLQIYDRPLLELLSTEQLAEEVVRTLTAAIGLVLAVPATTGLAALVAAPHRPNVQL